jgi:hypothetical protein
LVQWNRYWNVHRIGIQETLEKEKEILANGSVIIYKESVKLAGIITDFIFILFPRKLGKVTLGITGIAINESSIK